MSKPFSQDFLKRYSLIVADLDGTLVDKSLELSPESESFIKYILVIILNFYQLEFRRNQQLLSYIFLRSLEKKVLTFTYYTKKVAFVNGQPLFPRCQAISHQVCEG